MKRKYCYLDCERRFIIGWWTDHPASEIAAYLGRETKAVYRAGVRWGLPPKQATRNKTKKETTFKHIKFV